MKKIVFISHYFPRLPIFKHHGSWALDQAIALSANYNVTVITIKPKVYWFMRILSKKFKQWANIYDEIKINKNLDIKYIKVNPIAFKARELLYIFPEYYSTLFLKKYKDIIIKLRPDLLIGNHTLIEGLVCKKISEKHNIPYITFEHSPDDFIPRSQKHKIVYQAVISNALCFVNVSKYSESLVGKYYNFKDVNCKVLYNYSKDAFKYLNTETSSNNLPSFYDKRKKYIISVASYIKRKNQLYLIDFFSKNKNEVKEWELIIIGGYTSYYEKVKKVVSERNLKEKVHLLTNYTHEQVLTILNYMDIFVLPSESEMFNVAVLEAISAGLPVIVTNRNGTSDEFFAKYSLISSDPDKPDETNHKLMDLIVDEDKRKAIGTDNRKLYEEHFTFEKYVSRMNKLIEDVLL